MRRRATVTGVLRFLGRYVAVLTFPDGTVEYRRLDTKREARSLVRTRSAWGVRVAVFRLTAAPAPTAEGG